MIIINRINSPINHKGIHLVTKYNLFTCHPIVWSILTILPIDKNTIWHIRTTASALRALPEFKTMNARALEKHVPANDSRNIDRMPAYIHL